MKELTEKEIEEGIKTAIWIDNYDVERSILPDRVYISFSKKYWNETVVLTEKQVDIITDELIPVMFQVIIKKLQEFKLIPSGVKSSNSSNKFAFSFFRKCFIAILSQVRGNG